MKFNPRAFATLVKGLFFAASFLTLLVLGMVSGQVSGAPASDIGDDMTATVLAQPTNTPIGFTPSPFPTSEVPANIIVVDNGNYNYGTSLALNPDGIPVIAYAKGLSAGLALARCNNALTCDTPQIVTLDSNAANPVKLVMDGDIPVFLFVDTDKYLKLGRCNTAACSSITMTTIETTATTKFYALALDQNHQPVVAYFYAYTYSCGGSGCAGGILKLAHCTNPTCTTRTVTQLESDPYLRAVAVAVGSSGNPVVSYNLNFGEPHLTLCIDPACDVKQVASLGSNVGTYSSLQLNSSGNPVVAYLGGVSFKVITCNNNITCDAPSIAVIDNVVRDTNQRNDLSLAIDINDTPIISYYNYFTEDLKFARCMISTCAVVQNAVLDSYGRVGTGNSLALSDGVPYISYINQTTGKVMLYIEDLPPPPTNTPEPTETLTPTDTLTPSITPSPTETLTPSLTPSITPSPTETLTPSLTPSPTLTPSQTPITPTSPPQSTPAPAFFATRHPTLTWNAVSWAQSYQIEIDNDPAFGSPFVAEVDANMLTYTVESALADGTYFWHVRAKQNTVDWGNWSATETMVVSAP